MYVRIGHVNLLFVRMKMQFVIVYGVKIYGIIFTVCQSVIVYSNYRVNHFEFTTDSSPNVIALTF